MNLGNTILAMLAVAFAMPTEGFRVARTLAPAARNSYWGTASIV